MLVIVWIVGGVLALGALASSLPPRTWWLGPLAIAWMVGIIPVAIFSMNAGHPWKTALSRAITALRSYLSVMAMMILPAIVVAAIVWLVKH